MENRTLEEEIKHAAEVLSSGGLILYPTDTIWGIGCDATRPEAVEKIYRLKQRDDSKSMIILLDRDARLPSYVDQVPEQAWTLIEYSETPLTIVYDRGRNLAPNLLAQDGSIAIRVTKDEFCSRLITRFKKPIVSTSANISGSPAPSGYEDIAPAIREGVDYIVNLRRHERSSGKASTIIRLRNDGRFEFIRK